LEDRLAQAILRTHTTATSIRALHADPRPPRKIFTIGKVFRRETISYKHLPEFFQIDGIIVDEDATLATLKGTLTEYYRQLGFPKVKFKPSFFPYTEPSAEVYVWHEGRDRWVEMGGSGIFRQEVTAPFGIEHPVLAWGLGLERLAMLKLERRRYLQLACTFRQALAPEPIAKTYEPGQDFVLRATLLQPFEQLTFFRTWSRERAIPSE